MLSWAMDSSRVEGFLHNPPIVLFFLTLIAAFGFWGVSALVRSYDARQQSLAVQLFQEGEVERHSGLAKPAVASLRAALTYDPENYQYQLSLAEALADAGSYEEAKSYLLSLWERVPQDGEVNLQLGRMAAREGNVNGILRYYHNAMYGIWPSNADVKRRQTRFELINVLLQHQQVEQAQSELIALAAVLPPDPTQHLQTADLFGRAGDYRDALRQYQDVLRLDRRNPAALVGAGKAAFELEDYRTAERYLQGAKQLRALEPQDQELLHTASLILEYDPYRRNLSAAERHRRARAAFQQAKTRLQACAQADGEDLNATPPSTPLQNLQADWQKLKPKLRSGRSPMNFETVDQTMNLVFRIEQQTQKQCGNPQGFDLALLLMAGNREGADK